MGWSDVWRRAELAVKGVLCGRVGEFCPFDSFIWPTWPLACYCCGRIRDRLGGRDSGRLVATGGRARRARERGGVLQRRFRGPPPVAVWWPREDYYRLALWEITLATWLFLRCYRWPRGLYQVHVEESSDRLLLRVSLQMGATVSQHVLNVGAWNIG